MLHCLCYIWLFIFMGMNGGLLCLENKFKEWFNVIYLSFSNPGDQAYLNVHISNNNGNIRKGWHNFAFRFSHKHSFFRYGENLIPVPKIIPIFIPVVNGERKYLINFIENIILIYLPNDRLKTLQLLKFSIKCPHSH